MKALGITSRLTVRETNSFRQYLNEIADIEMFSLEEEAECALKAMNGDKASSDELVRRNLRFVISVAKQYKTSETSIEDLVNEGNIGLIMAVEKYNPNTGFKFITYAVFWIRKMILEYLAKNGKLIRLPSNKLNGLSKLNQRIVLLEQQLGRTVDISEVSDIMEDMSDKEISELHRLYNFGFDSLDGFSSDKGNDNFNLYDTVADTSVKTSDHRVSDADTKLQVDIMLKGLKPRDKGIIIALYGLDGSTPMPLKEIGEHVGLTREMVRQIKEKCLRQLKNQHSL